MENIFPILDITYLTEKIKNSSKTCISDSQLYKDPNIQDLVHRLGNGFKTWGFLYVKGHQISEDIIQSAFQTSKQFFEKPMNFKMNYKRGCGIEEGFVPPNGEIFEANKPEDMKELLDYRPGSFSDNLARELPDSIRALNQLFEECKRVLFILLRLIAMELGIDTEYYVKSHSKIGNSKYNGTSLRTLYYPPISNSSGITTEHRRCREHTDYGTITLLFQDQIGGLEVESPSGKFVKAVPIPGAIVINAGDLFHAWSKGTILATTHRVTIPSDPNRLKISRQSIAFFSHPNYDVTIDSTDKNGNSYTRNSLDYLSKRFMETIVTTDTNDR